MVWQLLIKFQFSVYNFVLYLDLDDDWKTAEDSLLNFTKIYLKYIFFALYLKMKRMKLNKYLNFLKFISNIFVSGRKDVDLDEKDDDGKTAEDYAREKDNIQILAIIRWINHFATFFSRKYFSESTISRLNFLFNLT